MALSYWEASLATGASRAGVCFTSVLMLGRQTSLLDCPALNQISRLYGADLSALEKETWAEAFFRRLGAIRVESLDYCDYEGAGLTHDMNLPWPEGQPPEQFDVVFDGGTLEHVFNLPQALLNAMSLVKPGGCLLSVTPADGWLGHGFHQLQPELFFRFLIPQNGFRLHGVWLAEFDVAPGKAKLFRLRDPAVTGCRPQVPGKRPLVLLVCAEKMTDLKALPEWPGQSNYTSMWQEPGKSVTASATAKSLRQRLLGLLPDRLLKPLRRWLRRCMHARLAKNSYTQVDHINFQVPLA
jgi:SAM-dependent methyltransferase